MKKTKPKSILIKKPQRISRIHNTDNMSIIGGRKGNSKHVTWFTKDGSLEPINGVCYINTENGNISINGGGTKKSGAGVIVINGDMILLGMSAIRVLDID